MLRTFSVAAIAAGAFLAPTPHAATTTTKYKIEQTSVQEIDATGVGGAKQTINGRLAAFVTVTLADTTGGRTMHAVVDSVQADSVSQIPQSVLDSLKGSAHHAFVAPNGKISDLKAMNGQAVNAQINGLLRDFFPRVKTGTKPSDLKPGDVWTDTTEANNEVSNGQMTIRTVTNYKAMGKEPRGGTSAMRIDAAFSASLAGTQETPNGTANIEGTAAGAGTEYLGSDGQYLGGSRKHTSSLTITIANLPAPIPITITQTTAVSVLK